MTATVNSDQLFGRVVAQRVGGTAQVASNATSTSAYGWRSLTLDGLLLNTDADALLMATYLANRYGTPVWRFQSITLNVNVTDEASVDAGFAKARAVNGQERYLVNCAGGGRGGKTIARDRQTGEIKPWLAESFSANSSATAFTFKLREGVTKSAWFLYPAPSFPNGQPMPLVPIDLGEFDEDRKSVV